MAAAGGTEVELGKKVEIKPGLTPGREEWDWTQGEWLWLRLCRGQLRLGQRQKYSYGIYPIYYVHFCEKNKVKIQLSCVLLLFQWRFQCLTFFGNKKKNYP